MNYTNYLLFMHWFNNIIKNKVNDEILFIRFSGNTQKRTRLINEFKNSLLLNKETQNYNIIDIKEINSFNEIEKIKDDKNIIVLGTYYTEINMIIDFNGKMLMTTYDNILNHNIDKTRKVNFILSEEMIIKTINSRGKPKIDEVMKYQNYVEKSDPLKIIFSNNYLKIKESIFNVSYFFENIEVLKSHKNNYRYDWDSRILEDIDILLKYKILTSRLAIAIYKTSTLKLLDSNTKIGLFFKNRLGIKSKTTQLPNTNPIQKVKAYDIRYTKLN